MTLQVLATPEFPPVFAGHGVLACEDVVMTAARAAANGEAGAGDVFWSMETGTATAAFVLEPEVPLAKAAEMLPLLMVALGDAIGAIGPPNMPFLYRWPGELVVNGAIAGKARMVAPNGDDASVPDWLVVGFALDIEVPEGEPGANIGRTVLHLEGAGDLDRTQIIESASRHFLAWIDTWLSDGFRSAHELWTGRASTETVTIGVSEHAPGLLPDDMVVGLDEHCGLLVRRGGRVLTLGLIEALETLTEQNA